MARFMADKGMLNRLEQSRPGRRQGLGPGHQCHGFPGRPLPPRRQFGRHRASIVPASFAPCMSRLSAWCCRARPTSRPQPPRPSTARTCSPATWCSSTPCATPSATSGIYVGEGKFIHSPKPGALVRVEDMGVAYWAAPLRRRAPACPALPQRPASSRPLSPEPVAPLRFASVFSLLGYSTRHLAVSQADLCWTAGPPHSPGSKQRDQTERQWNSARCRGRALTRPCCGSCASSWA